MTKPNRYADDELFDDDDDDDRGGEIEYAINNGHWDDATRLLGEILKSQPHDHWALATMATVHNFLDRHTLAVGFANRSLGHVPGCPVALWEKAEALWMLGHSSEAIRHYFGIICLAFDRLNGTSLSRLEPDDDGKCWGDEAEVNRLVADCAAKVELFLPVEISPANETESSPPPQRPEIA